MLTQIKSVGDRIQAAALPFQFHTIPGTITSVKIDEYGIPTYGVAWDDGQYENETWGPDDLDELDESAKGADR